jgi:hypothetical protein
MSTRSFTDKFISGDVSNKFVSMGYHHSPKIKAISNIARVLCQVHPDELLQLMAYTNIGDSAIHDKDEDNFLVELEKICENVPRIKKFY